MWGFFAKLLDLFDNYILKQPKMIFEYIGIAFYENASNIPNKDSMQIDFDYILHTRVTCLKNYPQYIEKIEILPNKGKSRYSYIYLRHRSLKSKLIKFKDSKPIEIDFDITNDINELPYKKIVCHTTSGHRYKMSKEDITKFKNECIKRGYLNRN